MNKKTGCNVVQKIGDRPNTIEAINLGGERFYSVLPDDTVSSDNALLLEKHYNFSAAHVERVVAVFLRLKDVPSPSKKAADVFTAPQAVERTYRAIDHYNDLCQEHFTVAFVSDTIRGIASAVKEHRHVLSSVDPNLVAAYGSEIPEDEEQREKQCLARAALYPFALCVMARVMERALSEGYDVVADVSVHSVTSVLHAVRAAEYDLVGCSAFYTPFERSLEKLEDHGEPMDPAAIVVNQLRGIEDLGKMKDWVDDFTLIYVPGDGCELEEIFHSSMGVPDFSDEQAHHSLYECVMSDQILVSDYVEKHGIEGVNDCGEIFDAYDQFLADIAHEEPVNRPDGTQKPEMVDITLA